MRTATNSSTTYISFVHLLNTGVASSNTNAQIEGKDGEYINVRTDGGWASGNFSIDTLAKYAFNNTEPTSTDYFLKLAAKSTLGGTNDSTIIGNTYMQIPKFVKVEAAA